MLPKKKELCFDMCVASAYPFSSPRCPGGKNLSPKKGTQHRVNDPPGCSQDSWGSLHSLKEPCKTLTPGVVQVYLHRIKSKVCELDSEGTCEFISTNISKMFVFRFTCITFLCET